MFGWVDFSEDERRRAAEVLELAKSPGAIDELGLGVLRDGLANRLFPGTSTLHTHTRYYFLIAYLMLDLERTCAGRPLDEVREAYLASEKAMTVKLIKGCTSQGRPVEGVTGSNFIDTDRWVKQNPATMDWAAIQAYGIMTDPNMKLSGYFAYVSNLRPVRDGYGSEEDDCLDATASGLWHVPWEVYKSWNASDEIGLDMLEQEAFQLKQAICTQWPHSLYAALLMFPHEIPALAEAAQRPSIHKELDRRDGGLSFVQFADRLLEFPELLPETSFFDRELCQKAADLSSLVALLHVRFNCILNSNAAELEEAWEVVADPRGPYWERALRCDPGGFFGASPYAVATGDSPRNARTLGFLREAQRCVADGRLDELDALITKRERAIKGGARSKLANVAAYATAKDGTRSWYGGLEFTYRLKDALGFAREIMQPLEAMPRA